MANPNNINNFVYYLVKMLLAGDLPGDQFNLDGMVVSLVGPGVVEITAPELGIFGEQWKFDPTPPRHKAVRIPLDIYDSLDVESATTQFIRYWLETEQTNPPAFVRLVENNAYAWMVFAQKDHWYAGQQAWELEYNQVRSWELFDLAQLGEPHERAFPLVWN